MAVADYRDIILDAARNWNVNPAILAGIMEQETGGNGYRNGRPVRSSAGAGGLMQFMPGTARGVGIQNVDDPKQAIYGAAKHYRELLDQYKDPVVALMGYNASPQAVERYTSGRGPLPAETRGYIQAVQSHVAKHAPLFDLGLTQPRPDQTMSAPVAQAAAKTAAPSPDEEFLREIGAEIPSSTAPEASTDSSVSPRASPGTSADDAFLREIGAELPKPATTETGYSDIPVRAVRGVAAAIDSALPTVGGDRLASDYSDTLQGMVRGGVRRIGNVLSSVAPPASAAEADNPWSGNSPGQSGLMGGANPDLGMSPAVAEIGNAARRGFGDAPVGVSPEFRGQVRTALEGAGVLPPAGERGNVMQMINAGILNPLGTVAAASVVPGELALRGMGAGFRGAQEAMRQGGVAVGQPLAGRDAAAMLEAFPAGLGAAGLGSAPGAIPYLANRAAGRLGGNPLSPAAVVEPPAISNPLRAEAPPFLPPNTPAPAPVRPDFVPPSTVTGVAGDVTPLRAPAPGPSGAAQSVGAAGTPLDQFGRTAREIHGAQADMELADLMRPPKPGEAYSPIPGVQRTKAQIELNPSTSLEAKGLRQEFRGGFNDIEKANNEIFHNVVSDLAGSREQVATLKDARSAQATADLKAAGLTLDGTRGVSDATPVLDTVKSILSDPRTGERDLIKKYIAPYAEKLQNPDGSLKNDPLALYGIRENITDQLDRIAGSEFTGVERVRGQLQTIKNALDAAIEEGAPGFAQYRKNYSDASARIDAMTRLQDASQKLTSGADRTITFGNFDRMMKNLWLERHGSNPTAPAKNITQDAWDKLAQVHNELQRSASAAELARAQGSDTSQMINQLTRNGLWAGAHALAAATTGGWGNVAIPFIKPILDARRTGNLLHSHLNPDLSKYPPRGP